MQPKDFYKNRGISSLKPLDYTKTAENYSLNSEYDVSLSTLDAFAANWKQIDMLKLDVEGHELSAFKGAIDFLKTYTPVVICEIETDSESINELFDLVTSVGYSFYFFNNNFLFKIKKSDFKYFKGAPNFLLLHESEDLKSLVINILGEV